MGYLHAVHAYRGEGTLADPTQYFAQRGGKLLYQWNSHGQMSNQELQRFEVGAVMAVVTRTDMDIFASPRRTRRSCR